MVTRQVTFRDTFGQQFIGGAWHDGGGQLIDTLLATRTAKQRIP
jgi:hypothetical protein